MDYTHSNLDEYMCKGNYLLFETKASNKTGVDTTESICGRKTTRNSMYKGSLRLTYGTRSRTLQDGFLTKMSSKNIIQYLKDQNFYLVQLPTHIYTQLPDINQELAQ